VIELPFLLLADQLVAIEMQHVGAQTPATEHLPERCQRSAVDVQECGDLTRG
jgi:hypothetical protein